MNYYDSDAYKIVLDFKSELDKIMSDEIFRSDYIARKLAHGALYYRYTRCVLTCLADVDNAEKASQDVMIEFANFAAALGARVAKISY